MGGKDSKRDDKRSDDPVQADPARTDSVRAALRADSGASDLGGYDADATTLAPGKRGDTEDATADIADELASLQERLYAEATADSAEAARSVLLVLQGIDTSGKGGVVEHVVGAFGPAGVHVTSFKAPTEEERKHDFLWRIRNALPTPGIIGVFDRSHYEDVLIHRVHQWADEAELERRYGAINDFEQELVAAGTTVIKCFLHISYDEQRERLLARLDDPNKRWKFKEGDLEERALWPQYEEAFAAMLQRCSPETAPWYVIPSNSKWYRNWAVSEILRETLADLNPQYPQVDLDVEGLRARLQPPN